jgi:hypothetical protein
MRRILKFLLLVFLLNSVRYAIGWPLERLLIQERLSAVTEGSPDIFNGAFGPWEWAIYFLANFMTWFLISVIYVKIEPQVHGSPMRKSFKVYGVMFLYFVAVSVTYMNQYSHPSDFYVWNILDRMLIFPIMAVTNGLIYPRLFHGAAAEPHPRLHSQAHAPLSAPFPVTPHGSPDASIELPRP